MNTGEQLVNIRSENGFYSTLTITFQKGQLQKGSQQEASVALQLHCRHESDLLTVFFVLICSLLIHRRTVQKRSSRPR